MQLIGPKSKVLITGATGFLGSHLALALLKEGNSSLVCLARGKRDSNARDRVAKALESAWSDSGENGPFDAFLASRGDDLAIWETDLEALEGMDPALSPVKSCDEIWHLAAKVDFLEHRRSETFRCNVGGTRALLDFGTRTGAIVFNYFSTAYVAGSRSGSVGEDDDPNAWAANNPYEESKREAEALVAAWGSRDGRLTRILRPSIVVGDSRTAKADSGYGLYGFLSLMNRLGDDMREKMPEYLIHNPIRLHFQPGASLNLICVDQAIAASLALRDRGAQARGIFHLCHPSGVPLDAVLRAISETMGLRVESVPDEDGLNPIDALLNQQTGIFNCYLRNPKIFRMDKTISAIGADESRFSIGEPLLRELIEASLARQARLKESKAKTTRMAARSLERREIRSGDGQALAYYRGGQGARVLVIINAYGQSMAFWDWVIAHFAANTRILIWQARGTTSGAGGLASFYPVSVHVGDLAAILEAERVEECDLLGWCTGPKLSLEFYRLHPERVRSMVFVTAAFKGHKGMEDLNTRYESCMEPLCRMVAGDPKLAGSMIETLKGVLSGKPPELTGGEGESRERILEILSLVNRNIKALVIEPFLTERSVVSYARQLLDFWGHDVSGILGSVNVPVLFIAGELDNIASPRISEAVARQVPGSRYLEIKGGSHYPHFDNHELLNEILEAYLEDPMGFRFRHDLVKVLGPVEGNRTEPRAA
jgi:nucleoside-diphosphate-sugar epimerase/pimeloyl-ACP methyl ester carboxylesterase